MVRIFVSYAHEDENLRLMLRRHLAALRRDGLVAYWDDRQLTAGQMLDKEIDARLDTADVTLLLVSAAFIDSDYCWDVEMQRAMKRQDAGETTVISVILSDCDWRNTPLKEFVVLPTDGKAIIQWANHEDAMAEVARGIREVVERICQERE